MKKILTNKLFMFGYVSDMLSNFGDVLYYLALMNYVLLLPKPQFALAMITLSETLPILTGFAIGIYADKTANKVDSILMTLFARCGLYVLVGLVMGFSPSLWVVVVASLINLVSDLLGQYENGLNTPLSLRVLAADEREQAFAFRQSTSAILQIAFKVVAAALVGILSYQNLAFVNAGTFAMAAAIMLVLKPSFTKLLADKPIELAEDLTANQGNIFKEMWSSSKLVLREIKSIPVLAQALIIVPALNAIFSALDVILVYHLSQHPDMIIHNPATTIAILSIAMLLGTVLGGILVMGPFKNLDIVKVLDLVTFFPFFIFLAFLLHQTYAICVLIFFVSVLVGFINPKMTALVMNSLPEERLATIGAGLNTYFTASMFFAKFLVSGFLLVLTADQVTWLFLIASALVLVYLLRGKLAGGKGSKVVE